MPVAVLITPCTGNADICHYTFRLHNHGGASFAEHCFVREDVEKVRSAHSFHTDRGDGSGTAVAFHFRPDCSPDRYLATVQRARSRAGSPPLWTVRAHSVSRPAAGATSSLDRHSPTPSHPPDFGPVTVNSPGQTARRHTELCSGRSGGSVPLGAARCPPATGSARFRAASPRASDSPAQVAIAAFQLPEGAGRCRFWNVAAKRRVSSQRGPSLVH